VARKQRTGKPPPEYALLQRRLAWACGQAPFPRTSGNSVGLRADDGTNSLSECRIIHRCFDLCLAELPTCFRNFRPLKDFLAFWEQKLDGPLHSVTVAHSKLIKPAECARSTACFGCIERGYVGWAKARALRAVPTISPRSIWQWWHAFALPTLRDLVLC